MCTIPHSKNEVSIAMPASCKQLILSFPNFDKDYLYLVTAKWHTLLTCLHRAYRRGATCV